MKVGTVLGSSLMNTLEKLSNQVLKNVAIHLVAWESHKLSKRRVAMTLADVLVIARVHIILSL